MSLLLRVADLNSVVIPPIVVDPPGVPISGGAWWKKYRHVNLSRKRREELIEEVVEAIERAPEPVTVQEVKRDYQLPSLVGLSGDFQSALIREAVARVNIEIERRIEEEDEDMLLLN